MPKGKETTRKRPARDLVKASLEERKSSGKSYSGGDDLDDHWEVEGSMVPIDDRSDSDYDSSADHQSETGFDGEVEKDITGRHELSSENEIVADGRASKKQKLELLKGKKTQQVVKGNLSSKTDNKGRPRLFANVSADKQASILWQDYVDCMKEHLSAIEAAEPFTDTMFKCPAIGKHTTRNISLFIRTALPQWRDFVKASKNKGSNAKRSKTSILGGQPSVLIVCASAIRCTEVIKPLSEFRVKVSKLFAKHLKMEEQQKHLAANPSPFGIGTPARISKLIDSGALLLGKVELIIIDMNRDSKEMSILDVTDVAKDVMLLLHRHLLTLVKEGQAHLALY